MARSTQPRRAGVGTSRRSPTRQAAKNAMRMFQQIEHEVNDDDSDYEENNSSASRRNTRRTQPRARRDTRATQARVEPQAPTRATRNTPDRGQPVNRSTVVLEQPLSTEPRFFHIPIGDNAVVTLVNRSSERRQMEYEVRGKHARPLNAFFAYKMAYEGRISAAFRGQKISPIFKNRLAGQGWAMEPERVRERYFELAAMDTENHAAAFPGYRYQPNCPGRKPRKAVKTRARKARKEKTEDSITVAAEEDDSDSDSELSVLSDSDFKEREAQRFALPAPQFQQQQEQPVPAYPCDTWLDTLPDVPAYFSYPNTAEFTPMPFGFYTCNPIDFSQFGAPQMATTSYVPEFDFTNLALPIPMPMMLNFQQDFTNFDIPMQFDSNMDMNIPLDNNYQITPNTQPAEQATDLTAAPEPQISFTEMMDFDYDFEDDASSLADDDKADHDEQFQTDDDRCFSAAVTNYLANEADNDQLAELLSSEDETSIIFGSGSSDEDEEDNEDEQAGSLFPDLLNQMGARDSG